MNRVRPYVVALFQLPRRGRTALVLASDLVLCVVAAIIAFWLRLGEWSLYLEPTLIFIGLAIATWFAVAVPRGVYRSVLRFTGGNTVRLLWTTCAIVSVILAVLLVPLRIQGLPRTLAVVHPLVFFILLAGNRLAMASLLRNSLYSPRRRSRREVLIYGAGVAGQQLSTSIREHPELRVVGFVDDDSRLRNRRLEGHRIWHSSELEKVLASCEVGEILLALPTASRAKRRQIVELVREFAPGVGVRSLPNISEIASGRVSVSDLRTIQIEELLGRDQVQPDPQLMSQNIVGRCVMVTGAGGSIGSELCRQIIIEKPARIVLAEQSEHALYLIDTELREISQKQELDVEIMPRLVDVADKGDIERIYRECRPETVFHAAAYKHVTLVESDPIAGIRNNVRGTVNCCALAEEFGAQNFILVSTDKAVRPTSVMGASKRVCELVIQARAAAQDKVRFSAVRFGNVLGSSGSVVPLFRRQIAQGGPVTVTHPDATRYFMTVPEAAQLVIQAGAMAEDGDIFLLDMGEPVRISDLASMMIELSGLSVLSETNPDGDIAIVEIGLRSGEKLHEELLIGECGLPTSHPRIVRACESSLDWSYLEARLNELSTALSARDTAAALALVERLVTEHPIAEAEIAEPLDGVAPKTRPPSAQPAAAPPVHAATALSPRPPIESSRRPARQRSNG